MQRQCKYSQVRTTLFKLCLKRGHAILDYSTKQRLPHKWSFLATLFLLKAKIKMTQNSNNTVLNTKLNENFWDRYEWWVMGKYFSQLIYFKRISMRKIDCGPKRMWRGNVTYFILRYFKHCLRSLRKNTKNIPRQTVMLNVFCSREHLQDQEYLFAFFHQDITWRVC